MKEISNKGLAAFIFADSIEHASARFEKVQQIISINLLLPEIDILRSEICSCYVIASYTASITLTNHLLERYCKNLLTAFDSGTAFFSDFTSEENNYKVHLSKYTKKDLSALLGFCKTKGLLSKEDWKLFDKYREIFRNGFGHCDPAKILQGATFGLSALGVDGIFSEERQIKFEDMPNAGLAIDMFTQHNAWLYFVTVENFIRSTVKYFHNKNVDPGLPIVPQH